MIGWCSHSSAVDLLQQIQECTQAALSTVKISFILIPSRFCSVGLSVIRLLKKKPRPTKPHRCSCACALHLSLSPSERERGNSLLSERQRERQLMAPRLSLAPARAAAVARHGSPTRTELAGWRVGLEPAPLPSSSRHLCVFTWRENKWICITAG